MIIGRSTGLPAAAGASSVSGADVWGSRASDGVVGPTVLCEPAGSALRTSPAVENVHKAERAPIQPSRIRARTSNGWPLRFL